MWRLRNMVGGRLSEREDKWVDMVFPTRSKGGLCVSLGQGDVRVPTLHPHPAINSNLFFQESQKRRPERGWNGEHLLVILYSCLSS